MCTLGCAWQIVWSLIAWITSFRAGFGAKLVQVCKQHAHVLMGLVIWYAHHQSDVVVGLTARWLRR
jgi:hypothetical protein